MTVYLVYFLYSHCINQLLRCYNFVGLQLQNVLGSRAETSGNYSFDCPDNKNVIN